MTSLCTGANRIVLASYVLLFLFVKILWIEKKWNGKIQYLVVLINFKNQVLQKKILTCNGIFIEGNTVWVV